MAIHRGSVGKLTICSERGTVQTPSAGSAVAAVFTEIGEVKSYEVTGITELMTKGYTFAGTGVSRRAKPVYAPATSRYEISLEMNLDVTQTEQIALMAMGGDPRATTPGFLQFFWWYTGGTIPTYTDETSGGTPVKAWHYEANVLPTNVTRNGSAEGMLQCTVDLVSFGEVFHTDDGWNTIIPSHRG